MTTNDDGDDRPHEEGIEGLRGDVRSLRDYLEDRATRSVAQVAYSIDGRTFEYEAPLTLSTPVGGYVRLETTDDRRYLGQITTKRVVRRDGAELGFELNERQRDLFPDGVSVSRVAERLRIFALEGSGVVLGEIAADAFPTTSNADTFQRATLSNADADVVNRYLTGPSRYASLPVGPAAYVDGEATVRLNARGFTRHTFLCGQSGSGKTFSLGIVLEQLLLETDLRVVVIDPNSDFVGLDQVRPRDEVNRFRSESLSAEEYAALAERYRRATTGLHVFRPKAVATGDDDVLRVRFGDLGRREQSVVLRIDPLDDRAEYNVFRRTVERLGHRDYSWDEVQSAVAGDYSAEARQLGLRIENLDIADWDVWCSRGESSLVDAVAESDWRCLVVDIGTLRSPEEQLVAANAVLGRLWRDRTERRPTLVVIDEAHNVCPADPTDGAEAVSTRFVTRIAAEGRKYGLYLLLSTQRPDKVPTNVSSQCDNLILMRMNSSADVDRLATTFSQVPPELLAEATKFGLGQTLVAGGVVQNPTVATFEGRLSTEGGADVPADWASTRV